MDARRASQPQTQPRLRRVGFFAPESEPHDSPISASVPPPRHLSAAVPVPDTGLRRQVSGDLLPIGSYKPAESLLGTWPAVSSPSSSVAVIGDREFSEESSTVGWFRRSDSCFTGVGFDMPAVKPPEKSPAVNAENLSRGTGTLIVFLEFILFCSVF